LLPAFHMTGVQPRSIPSYPTVDFQAYYGRLPGILPLTSSYPDFPTRVTLPSLSCYPTYTSRVTLPLTSCYPALTTKVTLPLPAYIVTLSCREPVLMLPVVQ